LLLPHKHCFGRKYRTIIGSSSPDSQLALETEYGYTISITAPRGGVTTSLTICNIIPVALILPGIIDVNVHIAPDPDPNPDSMPDTDILVEDNE
jgi:hypothetical protein